MAGKGDNPNSLANLEKGKWKKGQSGNPNGMKPMPKHLKNVKDLDARVVQKTLSYFMEMDYNQLTEVLKDKSRPVMDHMIARICAMAIKNGDQQRLDFLFNRIIGKVKDKVEQTTTLKVGSPEELIKLSLKAEAEKKALLKAKEDSIDTEFDDE